MRHRRLLGHCPTCGQPLYIEEFYRPLRKPWTFQAEAMLIAGVHTSYIRQRFGLSRHQISGLLWRWKDKLAAHVLKHQSECNPDVTRPRPFDPAAKWR